MFVKITHSKFLNGNYKQMNRRGKFKENLYENENTQLFIYKFKNNLYVISNILFSPSFFCYTTVDPYSDPLTETLNEMSKWFSFDRFGRSIEDSMKLIIKTNMIEENDKNTIPDDCMIVFSKYRNIFGGYVRTGQHTQNNKPVFFNEDHKMFLYYLDSTNKWVIGHNLGSSYYFFHSDFENIKLPHMTSWTQFQIKIKHFLKSIYENEDENEDAKFTDKDFDCSDNSMGSMVLKKETHWVRGSKLQNCLQKPVLFSKISPLNIAQGNLGNCWLLSALASLAEFPKFIKIRTFKHVDAIAKDGKYNLLLYDMKKKDWIEVTIDDYIPCFKKTSWFDPDTSCFSKSVDNELCIVLTEKAFAKVAGSYEKLNGGYPALAWIVLTGCEVIEYFNKTKQNTFRKFTVNVNSIRDTPFDFRDFRLKSENKSYNFNDFFEYLLDCNESAFMMSASIDGDIMEKERDDGLIERHAYSVMKVYQKQNIRLLKLRNPWGVSTNCNRKKTLDIELKYKVSKDGIVCISADDFMKIFSTIQICKKSMKEFI